MKIIKAIILSVIAIVAIALGKVELRHLMHEGFWPGLAGVLMCLGVIVLIAAIRGRNRQNAGTGGAAQVGGALRARRPHVSADVGRLLGAYPGPITLKPSRTKWWMMTACGVVMTAASIFVGVVSFVALRAGQHDAGIGIAVAVFGLCFFGLALALSVRRLLGAVLQLDGQGFQVVPLFTRKRYLWTEVSDFQPYRFRSASGVRFDAVNPRSRLVGHMNGWFGYPNDALTDTYGLAPEDLADLMQAWQSAALDGPDLGQPLAPVADDHVLRARYAAHA